MIDIIPMMKVLRKLQGTCDTCKMTGELELIKTYQCLRLFFIPIFKWHTVYYLRHSCGAQIEIAEEAALNMLYGKVPLDDIHIQHNEKHDNRCKNCGNLIEEGYSYCPYCGRKKD